MEIKVREDGKIIRYNYNKNIQGNLPDFSYDFAGQSKKTLEKFSEEKYRQAKNVVADFCQKILEKGETVKFRDNSMSDFFWNDRYDFEGKIFINEIKTPININISVGRADLKVICFERKDDYIGYDIETLPKSACLSLGQADEILKDTINLRLEYGVEKGTQPYQKEAPKAFLRYRLSKASEEKKYIIDAVTGKLVDREEVFHKIRKDLNESVKEAKSIKAFTPAMFEIEVGEKEEIEFLEGVLSKDELDKIIKGLPEFGITDKFCIKRLKYNLADKKENNIKAEIIYICKVKDYCNLTLNSEFANSFLKKKFILDAYTGEVQEVSTSYPNDMEINGLDGTINTREYLDKFLFKYHGNIIDKLEEEYSIYKKCSKEYFFRQKENGHMLVLCNYIDVSVNLLNGAIDEYRAFWRNDIQFESVEDIISKEEALKIYRNSIKLELCYEAFPIMPMDLENLKLNMWGEPDVAYTLKLVYRYYGNDDIEYILAKTGEVVRLNGKVIDYSEYLW